MLALTIKVLKSNNYLATSLSCEVDKENNGVKIALNKLSIRRCLLSSEIDKVKFPLYLQL